MTKSGSFRRTVLRTAAVVTTVLIVVFLLVPQLTGIQLSLLARANTGYLFLVPFAPPEMGA